MGLFDIDDEKWAKLRIVTDTIDNWNLRLYNETTIRVDTECSFFLQEEGAGFGQDGWIDSWSAER